MSDRLFTLLERGKGIAMVGDRQGQTSVIPMHLAKQADSLPYDFYDSPRPAYSDVWRISRVVNVGGEAVTVDDTLVLHTERLEESGETIECECVFDVVEKIWYVRR